MAVSPVVEIKNSEKFELSRWGMTLSRQSVVWGHRAIGDCLPVLDKKRTPLGCMQIPLLFGNDVDLDAYVEPLAITPRAKMDSTQAGLCTELCALIMPRMESLLNQPNPYPKCKSDRDYKVTVTFDDGNTDSYTKEFSWCGQAVHFVFLGETMRPRKQLIACGLSDILMDVKLVDINRYRKLRTTITNISISELKNEITLDREGSLWKMKNKCTN